LTRVNGGEPVLGYAREMTAFTSRLLTVCGWTSLALGAAGLVLPVVPTVPFVLLAAACFLRASDRRYRWLVSHPVLGPHISDYLAGKGLRTRVKALALLTLWASVLVSVVLFIPLPAADVVVLAVAAIVSVFILRLPTNRQRD
jgi:uncharacterized membrane protein YbaN (DUF454 family)